MRFRCSHNICWFLTSVFIIELPLFLMETKGVRCATGTEFFLYIIHEFLSYEYYGSDIIFFGGRGGSEQRAEENI
jgi:hypothetical protein